MKVVSLEKRTNTMWKEIMQIPQDPFLHSAATFHRATLRMALSLNGPQRDYINRMFLGTGEATSLVNMLGMRTDGSSLNGSHNPNGPCVKWNGSPPDYALPPSKKIVIPKVIEARRMAYWAQIQSPEHDGLSDKEIMDYSRKCIKHSVAEFVAQMQRDHGGLGGGEPESRGDQGQG